MSIGNLRVKYPATYYTQPPSSGSIQRNTQREEKVVWPPTYYQPYNEFRENIALLNASSCRRLMDYLESTEDKNTNGNNGRFGPLGIYLLANLDVNDPRWEQVPIRIDRSFRPRVKNAARQALQQKDLLKQICGEDNIFERQDMANWLRMNPSTLISVGEAGEKGRRYNGFRAALKTLIKLNGTAMMDYLEWDKNNKKANRHNGRFGLMGMHLLANLDVNAPQWEKVDADSFANKVTRRLLINAAKVAMYSYNQTLLFQAHNGDGVFEKDELGNWLHINPEVHEVRNDDGTPKK